MSMFIEIVEAGRPEKEPRYLIPEAFAPKWELKEGGEYEFIECGTCRVKPGCPDLCYWCLYVRERKAEPIKEHFKWLNFLK